MPIGALIPAVDFVVVFVPRLQHAGPRLALRLRANHAAPCGGVQLWIAVKSAVRLPQRSQKLRSRATGSCAGSCATPQLHFPAG